MRSKQTCQPGPIQVSGQRQNQAGFTIIEVLMAICIFAVGMLAVATMQYSAIRVNSSANLLTMRTTHAMDRMEKLMALAYSNAAYLQDNTAVDVETEYQDNNPPQGVTIKWFVDTDNPIQGSQRIRVQVTEGGKTTQLVTIKSNI